MIAKTPQSLDMTGFCSFKKGVWQRFGNIWIIYRKRANWFL